uniref:Uncharacterized protein n=1 Tax=Picea sitchensis TaxID=3332 RepID=A9NXK7_PICSI|nr:unknown [Picea sitchensis]
MKSLVKRRDMARTYLSDIIMEVLFLIKGFQCRKLWISKLNLMLCHHLFWQALRHVQGADTKSMLLSYV